MEDPLKSECDAALAKLARRIRDFSRHSEFGSYAVGDPEADAALHHLGNEIRATLPPLAGEDGAFHGPDVYVATELPQVGGHSLVIGDFVSALQEDAGEKPVLLLTNFHRREAGPLPEWSLERIGFTPDRVEIVQQSSPAETVRRLLERLLELRPARLFLFQHPKDPLPVAAALPELAGTRFLVHHSDHMPTFGLHLPGMRVIELHASGASQSRFLGIPYELLLLTAPDPGPRPVGFLEKEALITGSSGRPQKFERPYFLSYPDAVGVILRTTRGWHLHLGPLADTTLSAISAILERDGIAADRFIHVPWVPSVAEALWEHRCDLYISSFPMGGARTDVEVAASGTPLLLHQSNVAGSVDATKPAGSLNWQDVEELAAILEKCHDREWLETQSRLIRAYFDEKHHATVFSATLRRIVAHGKGAPETDVTQRDAVRLQKITRALYNDAVRRTHEELELRRSQKSSISGLQKRVKALETRLKEVARKAEPPVRADSSSRWWRWLRKS
ncbi:MAG: hypothetical protein ABIT76_00905 [Chthoniobacterales bacterium]